MIKGTGAISQRSIMLSKILCNEDSSLQMCEVPLMWTGLGVILNMALDMCENLYLSIPYQLKNEQGEVSFNSIVELVT